MKQSIVFLLMLALPISGFAQQGVPEATSGFRQPMDNYNPNNYGYVFNEWSNISDCYHPGWDYNGYGNDLGEDISAVANGLVVDVVTDDAFGFCVAIEHNYNGTTVYSQYAHLQSALVSEGQTVQKGQHIAELGESGSACISPHLHWEIREADHQNPQNAAFWDHDAFQSQSTINDWYEDPQWWCNNHGPYNTFLTQFVDFTVTEEGPYFPDQLIHCAMRWRNVGTATWSSTSGNSYVELGSCNSNGNIVESWLYGSGLDWISSLVPCTFTGNSIEPNEIATFSFLGKIPENADPGQTPVYFGAVYDGSIMNTWAGNGITLTIGEVQSAPENTPDIVRLRPDGCGGCVFRVAASNGSEAADYGVWMTLDWIPDAWFLADVHNDGLANLVLVNGNSVYLAKSLGDHFQNPVLWKSNWGTPSGTFGYLPWMYYGDNRVDLIHYRAVSASQVRWWGLRSTGSSFADLGVLISDAGNQSDDFFGVGSFHGERRQDVIFGRRNSGGNQLHFRVTKQNNDGTFEDTGWWNDAFGFYYSTILVADIDGDDYDDLVAVTHQGGNVMRVTWARNTHNETFASGLEMHSDYGSSGSRYYVADLDVDGHDDIVMINPGGNIYWARTYQQGSSWKLSGRMTWLNYFAQGANDQFCFANVTNQAPVMLNSMPGGGETVLKEADVIEGDQENPAVPKTPTLSAFPNPLNPQTTVQFELSEEGKANIYVYNLRGRKVRTLFEGTARAGPNRITWDGRSDNGSSLATGIYFLRMVTEKQVVGMKLVLLK